MRIEYLAPLYLGGTVLFLIFLFFLFFYVIIHSRKQRRNELERSRLIARHQRHILNARLEEQQRAMNQQSRELQEILGRNIDLTQTNLREILSRHIDAENARLLSTSVHMLEEAGSAMLYISNSLNSNYLKARGLPELISNELTHIGMSGKVACRLVVASNYQPVQPDLEQYIFRIAQEAINNAVIHARATELTISLNSLDEKFIMIVNDNGIGFDPVNKEVEEGQGFRHMREKAELVAGTIFIQAAPGKGCRITLLIDNVATSMERLVF